MSGEPITNHDQPGDAGHLPVMLEQVLGQLEPRPGQVVLDCTIGRAGHAAAVIDRIGPDGWLIGLDLDPANVAFARQRLADAPCRVNIEHGGFDDAGVRLEMLGADSVDLLLADLGFASPQMDDPQRGFSFAEDGPLDMRMDSTAGATAADLVNALPADELANVIYQYGEERLSRVIARKIVEQRRDSPIKTTRQLAELCAAAYGPRAGRQRIHPATRTFMALRIAVNDELNRLERLLDQLPELIGPSGRAAIISFHSLEDRQVKHAFRRYAAESGVRLLTKKPLRPEPDERHANPRCRSAKLRAIAFEKTHGVA